MSTTDPNHEMNDEPEPELDPEPEPEPEPEFGHDLAPTEIGVIPPTLLDVPAPEPPVAAEPLVPPAAFADADASDGGLDAPVIVAQPFVPQPLVPPRPAAVAPQPLVPPPPPRVAVPPPPPPGAPRRMPPPPPPGSPRDRVQAPSLVSSLRAATGRLRGRTRLIILVAAVLVVVGAVVAIAGGGGSDANAKFLAQANSICRSEEPAINSSGDPVQVAQLASQLLGNLQALGTPPRNAALWQQWLGAEEQAVQLLASGQTQEALAQARALSPLARQLGISACA